MRSLNIKYRPQTFDEVVGQDAVVTILKTQLDQDSIGHALLFAGKTGTGKTSIARLLAKAINKGEGEPIEIDAASNSGVDNVRAIIEDAQERAVDCIYKVFIIDEAQGLSNAAWQAFLKCIEEPPKYTIFIFCTTDPQKIPATIMNRVQSFTFKSISHDLIAEKLCKICKLEGFTDYQDGVMYISKAAQGCMREALTLLDKCADYSTSLTLENVARVLGTVTLDSMFELLNCLLDGKQPELLQILNDVLESCDNTGLFVNQFLEFLINIQKYIVFSDVEVTYFSSQWTEALKYVVEFQDASNYYNYLINKVFELKNYLKNDSDPETTITVLFMQMLRGQ